MPDPRIEKAKQVIVYEEKARENPDEKIMMHEIVPGHMILCEASEIDSIRKRRADLEKKKASAK
ncbi:hypothetical protein EII15_21975 [Bacillus licheniformis]|nr:hypothetical protein EII15_21975 [Bacillus licheniformis]